MQTYEPVKSVLLIVPEPALVLQARQALAGVRCPGKATLVREYPSAAQLISLVSEKNPALVLVSMQDAARALAVIESLNRTGPVLAAILSEHDAGQAEAAVQAGAADILEAPLDPARLEQLLSRVPARPAAGVQRPLFPDPQPHARRRRKRRKRAGRDAAPSHGSLSYTPVPALMPGPSLSASPETPPAA